MTIKPVADTDLAAVTGGAKFKPSHFREAGYIERFVRNFRDFRKSSPRAGIGAALNWAAEDPLLPYYVRK